MDPGNATQSLELVRDRAAAVGPLLRAALLGWDEGLVPAGAARRDFVCTGAGASEGPARFLVALCRRHLGVRAHFAPLSAFAAPNELLRGDALVVFSQGLSPNARLALGHAGDYALTVLFTSVAPDAAAPESDPSGVGFRLLGRRGRVAVLPPASEARMLVRLSGPAVATLGALLFAADLARGRGRPLFDALPDLPRLIGAARRRVRGELAALADELPFPRVAFVAAAGYGEYCHGLRWKLLEGLGLPDPPVWDVLQIVHGPLQQFYDERLLVVTLESAGRPRERPLFDRLAQVLVPGRHRLLRLEARAEPPFSWFEHDALCNALLVKWLEKSPRDLIDWPGKDADGPLYCLEPGALARPKP
ncbi:MAG: hypothetical protein IT373_09855 [Polyangiaceae bacterium]|nr:hypothetical protein [Polyangiaceae bacterium]